MMKKVIHANNRSVIGILFVLILLLPMFISTIRANVSGAADSVYFHIKLDTLGGISMGRVLKLTYALANSKFDTAVYPVFNDSIERISGPEQYKGSSYALLNGEESKSSETGFHYLIRFSHSGEIELPAASVTVENRTYTTPEYRVTVRPAEIDMNALECDLVVRRLPGIFVTYCATLTCNACPDQNPPLLTINGKTVRPSSNSYSSSEGKEEYIYNYYFSSDGYEVSCKELTFGGKPYPLRPQKSKMDDVGSDGFV